jgi:cytochrome c-type biogenesis protein CcmE
MKPKHQRLLFVTMSLVFLMAAVLLTMQAFKENLVYFYSPTDIAKLTVYTDSANPIRIGGLVKEGSIHKTGEGSIVFTITDGNEDIRTYYTGMLPNLFREGQGVVAEGRLGEGKSFKASTILAKHDENYMPKEVVDSLKESGRWQGDDAR